MAAYPSEYQLDIVLRNGQVAHVRPIRPSDGDLLVDFFERLGPESRYFRFFRVKRTLAPEEVRYFTTVDYERRMALIVVHEGRMAAVGRYDVSEENSKVAEVAFAVADDQQGLGLGTELLQLLTAYARSKGIGGFRAFVLPENVQMMRVFRNSGFELHRTLESGVYTVDFPVALTQDSKLAAEEREKRAVAASMLPMFFPRSVAVVGASTRPGSIGNTLFRNLLHTGFGGTLYPVNPTAQVVNAVKAYPSVLDIPDAVDLAFVVVPSEHVLAVARDCAAKGVRAIVVISAGFGEVAGGRQREAELLAVVREAGMRMVGPNCMGLLNTAAPVNMNGTFAPVYPPAGNIAMSSQSGALGIAILEFARRNSIGISQFVSVGNKADVSGNDLLLFWEDDPATDVILLYLESFGNPRRFARLARRISRKKPIVAVKSGRTAAGSRAASSHTGALASTDRAVEALFRQSGVIRVDTLEELFAVGSLLANQPIPAGRRVGIVTNAGGPGILAADALESQGLFLPEFSAELRQVLSANLPAEASVTNPVDLIAGAGPVQYSSVLQPILDSGEVDALLVIYVPTSITGVGEVGAAVRAAAEAYQGPCTLLSVFMQAEDAAAVLTSPTSKVPTYQFPEGAARALTQAVAHGEWLRREPGRIPELVGIDASSARSAVEPALARFGTEGGWLEPAEVEALLAAVHIPVPASVTVAGEEEAVEAAREIGFPVVLKVVSSEALHKSEVGGVALDLEDEEAVRAGFRSVTATVEQFDGVLVQEMVRGGHEVLIGMSEDPNFGPLLVYGLGGVYVELLEDVAFRLYPLTDTDATEMMAEIKGARLLEGYRNMPLGDLEAVKDVLLRVSALVGVIPEITEMDLNPVKVLPPGEGVRVVDARIKVAPVEQGWTPEIIDLPGVAGARQA
jgi:acetyl coenzyme A synthetase (ADP forming)-like protein